MEIARRIQTSESWGWGRWREGWVGGVLPRQVGCFDSVRFVVFPFRVFEGGDPWSKEIDTFPLLGVTDSQSPVFSSFCFFCFVSLFRNTF